MKTYLLRVQDDNLWEDFKVVCYIKGKTMSQAFLEFMKSVAAEKETLMKKTKNEITRN